MDDASFAPPIRWIQPLCPIGEDEADPKAHLLGTVEIADVPHHAEAIQVEDRDGAQEAVVNGTNFDRLSEIEQQRMATVKIDGRPYVLLITPYGE